MHEFLFESDANPVQIRIALSMTFRKVINIRPSFGAEAVSFRLR